MALDYTQIGKRIAKRRKELKLTQAKVAELADIGEKYLSSIERAYSIPSTEVVMRIAIAWRRRRMNFWSARPGMRTADGRMWRRCCVG